MREGYRINKEKDVLDKNLTVTITLSGQSGTSEVTAKLEFEPPIDNETEKLWNGSGISGVVMEIMQYLQGDGQEY